MAVAGEWQSLENGSRWRLGVAGEWQSLKIGSRWSRWRLGALVGALGKAGYRDRARIGLPKGLGGNSTYTVTTSLLDFDSNNDSSGAPMCSSSSCHDRRHAYQ